MSEMYPRFSRGKKDELFSNHFPFKGSAFKITDIQGKS